MTVRRVLPRALAVGCALALAGPWLLAALAPDGAQEPAREATQTQETPARDERPEAAPQEVPEPEAEPLDSGLAEQVDVRLVEVAVLVTDKRGRPITDLAAEEVRVFEDGEPQRLAYLEPIRSGKARPSPTEQVPAPAPLYTPEGPAEPTSVDAFPTPKPVRRIVLAFDVRNSKQNARERWQEAALDWLAEEVRPDDQVAIVIFRTFPEWLVEFTGDARVLESALEKVSLVGGAADRDRRRDMSQLIEDIRNVCWDPGKLTARDRRPIGGDMPEVETVDKYACSYAVTEPYVVQWDRETQETIETMRALTGQLAAVPGRKAVLLFSDGLIVNASNIGAYAMTSVHGTGRIDPTQVAWRLNRTASRSLDSLFSAARAADVAFYTFDTRRGHDTGFGGDLEQAQIMNYFRMGINPWSEMHHETRGALTSLAKETGGRSYHGNRNLESDLKAAADSFFGHYAVGYYRSNPKARLGRVQVKIDRRKLAVTYPDRAGLGQHRPRPVHLDIIVRAPQVSSRGDRQRLPVSLTMDIDSLPLRRGAGGQGLQLGAFVQAIRPDGTIADETLDVVTVVLGGEELRAAHGKKYEHRTAVEVEPGPYRIRARLSDDRQVLIADRTIDLTVRVDGIEPGVRGGPARD